MVLLKDILGKPGEGIHFHLPPGPNGIAVVDVLGTIALAALLAWLMRKYEVPDTEFNFWCCWLVSTVGLLFIGEVLHLLIGVDTTVVRFIRGVFN